MARAKNKVEHRLSQMLSQFRELHRLEKNDEDKEALRQLVAKQLDLMEWASEAFPMRRREKQA